MIKKTLLALTISSSLISGVVFAADDTENGILSSATTEPSVGHRPVAVVGDGNRSLQIKGKLITNEEITIESIFIVDPDGDGDENNTQGKASLAKTEVSWYIRHGNNDSFIKTQYANLNFKIPSNASGKNLVVKYKPKTNTGYPDEAYAVTEIVINEATSGVGGTDGKIKSKIASMSIDVDYQPSGQPGAAPTNSINGTDTKNTPVVNSILKANITCEKSTANCNDELKDYKFAWQAKNAGTNNPYEDISGANQLTYKITADQQNKLFRVLVTPKENGDQTPAVKKT